MSDKYKCYGLFLFLLHNGKPTEIYVSLNVLKLYLFACLLLRQ